MRRCALLIAIVAIGAFPGRGHAEILQQEVLGTFGERAEWFACVYECKDAPDETAWQEVTTLMLVNPTLADTRAQMFS